MSMGPEWKYRIVLRRDDWPDVQSWCEQTLGKFNDAWYKLGIDHASYIIHGYVETVWYFKHERDAVLFQLRWA